MNVPFWSGFSQKAQQKTRLRISDAQADSIYSFTPTCNL
jgi:hypothetical protein